MSISVPAGWTITVKCINDDVSGEYHSCAAVADQDATAPVFTGATTPNPLNGLGLGQTATFTFMPDKVGNYRFACLVGKHQVSGMWDVFDVTASESPSISYTAAATS
jgi:hypothetical protein